MSRILDKYPVKSIIGWMVIVAAATLNYIWLWGLMFMWWALASIRAKEVAFIDTVTREAHPAIYWTFVVSWMLVGMMYLAYGLFPEELAQYG